MQGGAGAGGGDLAGLVQAEAGGEGAAAAAAAAKFEKGNTVLVIDGEGREGGREGSGRGW